MITIDNRILTLKEDLEKEINKGSRVSIAAAYFSMYAFKELKSNLMEIEDFRFIFTQPTFAEDIKNKSEREFYIPKLKRESSLHGTEFEIKLKNEVNQKAISKECADWIRDKAIFKSVISDYIPMNQIIIENEHKHVYLQANGFTTSQLGLEKGKEVGFVYPKFSGEETTAFINSFEEVWSDSDKLVDITDQIIESLNTAYKENSPELIYYLTLYNVFNEFLTDLSEDNIANEATGFKESKIWNLLFDFQKDGVLAIINKLEQYNGCILADSVGLGKTFTALSVIKYYENRNKNVLVLCPKKLSENWNTYKENYINNPIAEDRLRYDVLYHTDLSRKSGESNGKDLSKLRWDNYDLLVIDESHNFRNGEGTHKNTVENRYIKLMNKVITSGVKTKVLMLSATPVNNRFLDLKNQLALAYEGQTENLERRLNTQQSIDEIFKQAQRAFTKWNEMTPAFKTTEKLQSMLNFDFFELLDSVTIARSRKHIEKYYNSKDIGKFPTRLKPISIRSELTNLKNAINYEEIYEQLEQLNLMIYSPSQYIFPTKLGKYFDIDSGTRSQSFYQGRETGVKKLMSINLLKRLESSVYAFSLTLDRVRQYIDNTIAIIDNYDGADSMIEATDINSAELDENNIEDDFFKIGKKVRISLKDMDHLSWKQDLEQDSQTLELISSMIKEINPAYDSKLNDLITLIENKIKNPINKNNKKVLVFTAFADTADYLYENIAEYMKEKYGLNTAIISGSQDGKSTIKGLKADFNNVLTFFSPISKSKDLLNPDSTDEIDILIATDVISEGQNLQDCDYLINYDIHWNPVRIIQRFGRIDRIGSKNDYIQLVNFWPDLDLDEYINLKSRVESRMKITVMTSTGDDDLINSEEKGDLEYRKNQLKKLQEEVVDLEDMSSGISIMDLGLNEFRLDLIEYIKTNKNLDKLPKGLHAVTKSKEGLPPGIIYILRNIDNGVNIDNQNRIHPFYMVYMDMDGNVVRDYLNPKKLLDDIRLLSRDEAEPIKEVYELFNKETKDGKKMNKVSDLLNKSISSIIDVKDESDLESFLSGGQVSFVDNKIKGIENFELVCFLVVR